MSCCSVRYLGMQQDKRVTWKKYIKSKRDVLNMPFRNIYWLMTRHSKLSIDNKLLIFKIWVCGAQLWGCASDSNLQIMQRMQNSILRTISNAPWFISNTEIYGMLKKTGKKYKKRLENHPNDLAFTMLATIGYIKLRLRLISEKHKKIHELSRFFRIYELTSSLYMCHCTDVGGDQITLLILIRLIPISSHLA